MEGRKREIMTIMIELKGLKGIWQAVCQICRFRSDLGPIEYIDKTATTHCREHKHNVDIVKIGD